MTVGEVIRQLRKEQRISQGDLSRGIISDSVLSRFESNEKKLDKIIIEALFQRLGKTFDKLEFQVSVGEYRMILLREQLINTLEVSNAELLGEYLKQYKKTYKSSHKLDKQFLLMIEGSEAYLINANKEKSFKLMTEAIEVTFLDWSDSNWDKKYLCIQEIQILTMMAYVSMIMNKSQAEELITRIIDFINKHYTDVEEKSKIMTPAYLVYIRLLIRQEKKEDAYFYCKLAKENLANIGMITLMDCILQTEIELTENKGKKEVCSKQYEAIRYVKRIIKKEDLDEFLQLLKINHQRELYISNEVLKDMRMASNISQEELGWEICAQETLSRAESGRTLNRKNQERLYEKLHIDPNLYSGNVDSSSYEVHRLVREFSNLWYLKERKKGYQLLKEIRCKIDMRKSINKQYIEHCEVLMKIENKKVGKSEGIKQLKRILQYTMECKNRNVCRIPSRTELQIILNIAVLYKQLKEYNVAVEIYRNLLDKYEKSYVDEIHHARSMILLYLNYSAVLEELSELEKSEYYAKKAISIAVNCGRGDTIGTIMANMSCIYNKKDNKKKAAEYVNHSMNLLLLYKHDKDAKKLKDYYKIK